MNGRKPLLGNEHPSENRPACPQRAPKSLGPRFRVDRNDCWGGAHYVQFVSPRCPSSPPPGRRRGTRRAGIAPGGLSARP